MEKFKVIGIERTPNIIRPWAVNAGLAASVLKAILHSISKERLRLFQQDTEQMTLEQLAVLKKVHEGTFGLCFEYAIHYGINTETSPLYEYVRGALRSRYKWDFPVRSVLAGIEKTSYSHLIENYQEVLGEGARLVLPCGEIEITENLLYSLRSWQHRSKLERNLRDISRADLLIGSRTEKLWTTASLKTNKEFKYIFPAITLMIYPFERQRKYFGNFTENDLVLDCVARTYGTWTTFIPVPSSGLFMEGLHIAYHVVVDVLNDDIKEPTFRKYPEGKRYFLAQFLFDHKKEKVSTIIEMLSEISNPIGHSEIIMPSPTKLITDPAEIRAYSPDEIGADIKFTPKPTFLNNPVADDIFR